MENRDKKSKGLASVVFSFLYPLFMILFLVFLVCFYAYMNIQEQPAYALTEEDEAENPPLHTIKSEANHVSSIGSEQVVLLAIPASSFLNFTPISSYEIAFAANSFKSKHLRGCSVIRGPPV